MTTPADRTALEIAREKLKDHWAEDDWQKIVCEAVVELTEALKEKDKLLDQSEHCGYALIKKKGVKSPAEELLLSYKKQSAALKEALGLIEIASVGGHMIYDRPIREVMREWRVAHKELL